MLLRLLPYSPELNPARLWEELREKEFANVVFDSLGAAIAQAARGMRRLEHSSEALQSLTGWKWILESSCLQLGTRNLLADIARDVVMNRLLCSTLYSIIDAICE